MVKYGISGNLAMKKVPQGLKVPHGGEKHFWGCKMLCNDKMQENLIYTPYHGSLWI